MLLAHINVLVVNIVYRVQHLLYHETLSPFPLRLREVVLDEYELG